MAIDEFPERLRSLRKQRGIGRKALGECCGVSKNMIGRYENGERVPNIYVARELANVLGVTMDYLCGNEKIF